MLPSQNHRTVEREREERERRGERIRPIQSMATAILRSHDVLRDRFGPRSLHSSNPSSNLNPGINNASRCHRRKRGSSDGSRRCSRNNISPSPAKSLVMGQVKILKRGEDLSPMMFSGAGDDLDLYSTDRLGPDPEVLQKQIRVRVPDLYAGPTSLVSSPPPSYLPFPSALVRSRVMDRKLSNIWSWFQGEINHFYKGLKKMETIWSIAES